VIEISLITICFNNESTIGDTLDSVIAQRYPELEYVIVDGGSTDATLEIIKSKQKPWFKVISEPDEGIYDALNKGIELSTGEVVGMLHADDVFADDNILNLVSKKFGETDCEALYGNLLYVNRQNLNKVHRKWVSGNYSRNAFKWGWMPPHPTFYVKKKLYENFGKFNLDLKSAADYELMLRFIHKNGISLGYLNHVMIKMRVGGTSNASLSNRLLANEEDQRAWEINHIKPYWFTRYLKPLRKVFQFIRK